MTKTTIRFDDVLEVQGNGFKVKGLNQIAIGGRLAGFYQSNAIVNGVQLGTLRGKTLLGEFRHRVFFADA